jgi:hypothetical protein
MRAVKGHWFRVNVQDIRAIAALPDARSRAFLAEGVFAAAFTPGKAAAYQPFSLAQAFTPAVSDRSPTRFLSFSNQPLPGARGVCQRVASGFRTGAALPQEAPPESIISHTTSAPRSQFARLTADADGRVTPAGLRKQIRITLLHELAHHFGMTDEKLEELGHT